MTLLVHFPRLVLAWINRWRQSVTQVQCHAGPSQHEVTACARGGLHGWLCSSPLTDNPRTSSSPVQIELRLLGSFRVSSPAGTVARWPCRKGKFLLAYLALNREKKVGRDVLMDMFWPGAPPQSARNCLNVTLHGLRYLLQTVEARHETILYRCEHYFLNPEVPMWLDVEEFSKGWKDGQRLEREGRVAEALFSYSRAANVYTGDLMEEDPYEDWLALERERLKELYLVVLGKVSRYYSLDGDPERAILLCESMLEKDLCQEEVYRRLMLCYHRLGLRDKALKQYSRCVEVLRKTLDVGPTPETQRLYEDIRRQPVDTVPGAGGAGPGTDDSRPRVSLSGMWR